MSVGLISEFNPFHYGHEYIIRKIHEITNEPVVCVMSGPFVQRGEPACVNKYERTKAALLSGADAIVELPVRFAVSAAKNFARGGVEVLKNVAGISSLAFGVETDAPEALFEVAMLKKRPETAVLIKGEMIKGVSYPTAVSNAINIASGGKYNDLLNHPNNVLAIEYIEALEGSGISPMPIKRVGSLYNEKSLDKEFASATALREGLLGGANGLDKFMPTAMLNACISGAPDKKLFDSLVLYALRRLSIEQLRCLPDVEVGLEYVIKKAANEPTLAAALEKIKSPRYTYARLKRIFIYALLGIDKQIMSDINSVKTRILGIKKEFKPHLADFNSNIITRNSDVDSEFSNDKSVSIDVLAEDIYSLLTGTNGNSYFTKPMIII